MLRNKYITSILSEVVIVGIDTAAELRCLDQPLPTHFIRLVERYVQLEEAGVRLREALIIPAIIKAKLMLSLGREVKWQTIATPDEFEIRRTLLRSKFCKDAPEAFDDLMTLCTVRVCRVPAQTFHINGLLAASTNLNCSWSQVAKYVEISFEDSIDTLLKCTILLEGLYRSSLDHERDEFFNV